MDHMIVELFSGCVYLINNGVTICWFIALVNTNTSVTFPVAFNTTNYLVFLTDRNRGNPETVSITVHAFCEWYNYRTVNGTRVGATDNRQSTALFVIGN